MAWLLAVAATLLSFVVHPLRPRDPDDVGAILALGLVVTLVLSSRLFPARSDQSRVRQGFFWLFGGELFVFLVGFIGLYVVDPELVEPVDLREATANALRLLFIVPAATVPKPGRPKAFVFQYRPPTKNFQLNLKFKRSDVEKSEVIAALQGIIEELLNAKD